MFGRKRPTVLIAGAGPAGLLGALCLAEHGIVAEIVDASPADEAVRRRRLRGAVTLLYPRTLELLDRYGIAGSLLARAQRVRRLGVYSDGERVGALSFEQLSNTQGLRFPFAAVVAVADLERCAADILRQRHIDVGYERRLARIEQGTARVRATVDHLGSDSAGYATAHGELIVERSEELDLDFVLAADGHQSLVRQQLNVTWRELGSAERYDVVDGSVRDRLPEEAALLFADGANGVLWPLPGGRWRFIAGPDSGARARLAIRARWLAPEGHELEGHGHIDVGYSLASPWGIGRVWLVGGAAHATSPLGAQSLNVGLWEAERLGHLLAAVLRGAEPVGALAIYERERSDEWARLLPLRTPRTPGVGGHPAAGAAGGYRGLDLDRLTPCVPASGADLDALLEQVRSASAVP